MATLWIHIPGHRPHAFGKERPLLFFGRSSTNDVVIEDPSISRSHAKLQWDSGDALLEDLGSRNGCTVNGERIREPRPVRPGDQIALGRVSLRLEVQDPMTARFEEGEDTARVVSFRMPVDQLRTLRPGLPLSAESQRWREALGIVHELSLELLGSESVELMLWGLLERLFAFLQPGRGAVLLKDAQGQLNQVAARSSSQGRDFQVRLSRTMVEAALERREAMLVNDPMLDARLKDAPSMMHSGITTIMTVPLEFEGETVGLVYLDAGPLHAPFTDEDLRLVASLGHLAAAKIRNARQAEEVAKKRDLDKELAIARQIQVRILPDRMPELEGYELFGTNVPSKHVSGDIFGYWPGPNGKLWLAVADVSGKGLGPGLLMATFQAYMQAWAESQEDPSALAIKLSLALSRKTTTNRFITAFLLLLDPHSNLVEFTNAGHNPVLRLKAGGETELLSSHGFPLAMFAGKPYGHERMELQAGDLLCIYTDGITEATDTAGEEFGIRGLEAVLKGHATLPLDSLHHELEQALERHTGGAPLADDRTLVMVRRKA
jgi:serine phosphatase RsbU (regulator of sigma subunit)